VGDERSRSGPSVSFSGIAFKISALTLVIVTSVRLVIF